MQTLNVINKQRHRRLSMTAVQCGVVQCSAVPNSLLLDELLPFTSARSLLSPPPVRPSLMAGFSLAEGLSLLPP